MLHQASHAALNEELERENEQLKNELKLAEQQLMYLTGDNLVSTVTASRARMDRVQKRR
jgi:hypothetical protein